MLIWQSNAVYYVGLLLSININKLQSKTNHSNPHRYSTKNYVSFPLMNPRKQHPVFYKQIAL